MPFVQGVHHRGLLHYTPDRCKAKSQPHWPFSMSQSVCHGAGIVPNYVKVIPSIAIAFVVYEQVSEALHVEIKISAS
jgi:hypothetical protein